MTPSSSLSSWGGGSPALRNSRKTWRWRTSPSTSSATPAPSCTTPGAGAGRARMSSPTSGTNRSFDAAGSSNSRTAISATRSPGNWFSAYQARLYAALESSDDPTLQAIAAKASREVRYHLEHAGVWVLRLAGGTELSRGRILQSILDLWPYVAELFEDDDLTTRLAPR